LRKAARAFGSPAGSSIRCRSPSRLHSPAQRAVLGEQRGDTRIDAFEDTAGPEVADLPAAGLHVGEQPVDRRGNRMHRPLVQEASELTGCPTGIDGGQQARRQDRPHPIGGVAERFELGVSNS
jgi:hypothetical protein